MEALPETEPEVTPAPRRRGRPPKAASTPALNATRHGLLATTPVIAGIERLEDWEAHVAGQLEAMKPEGELETVLAHRVALTLWRLNRLIGFEAYALRPSEHMLSEEYSLHRGLAGYGIRIDRIFPTGSIENVQRYEAHLHRLFVKDLHELEALQERRRGHATPLVRIEGN